MTSSMEIVARKKIQRAGKSSLTMPMPADLAAGFGVTGGSVVEYNKAGDTPVLKFPNAKTTPES